MSEQAAPTAENEVDVADVTKPDPLETVEVKTVSGNVEVVAPSAPVDGTITGTPVYSDNHCPILVADEDKDQRTITAKQYGQEGEVVGKTVLRRPVQVLTNPKECPSCGIMLEGHMLVTDPATGSADCPQAIAYRNRAKNDGGKIDIEAARKWRNPPKADAPPQATA